MTRKSQLKFAAMGVWMLAAAVMGGCKLECESKTTHSRGNSVDHAVDKVADAVENVADEAGDRHAKAEVKVEHR